VKAFSEKVSPIGPDQNLVRESDRLRRENCILKEEREVLKNAAIFSAGQKQ
jgi:transposase